MLRTWADRSGPLRSRLDKYTIGRLARPRSGDTRLPGQRTRVPEEPHARGPHRARALTILSANSGSRAFGHIAGRARHRDTRVAGICLRWRSAAVHSDLTIGLGLH